MAQRKIPGNWITNTATFVDQISMAPRQFHVWAAMSVVSSVLKNKIYFPYGSYTIYPNQYIVLVAPPGIGKGESIRYAYERSKTNNGNSNLINLISDRITAPKILERLAAGFPAAPSLSPSGSLVLGKDSSATLVSLELPILLTSSDWMLPFLCEAWDRGEYEYDTKNSGSAFVKGMCTSLVGACVPEYIRKLNKDATAAINSGFTARTMFVYADSTSKRLPWPKSVNSIPGGKLYQENLEKDLEHISTLKGQVTFNSEAKWKFEEAFKMTETTEEDSDVVAYFKSRMHVHIIKAAMTLSAAERDDLVVDKVCMINAIHCVKSVMDSLDIAFRGVGESDIAEATSKVVGFIEKRGLVTRQDLMRHLHRNLTMETLDRVMSLLLFVRTITSSESGGMTFYKLTKKPIPIKNNGSNGNGFII